MSALSDLADYREPVHACAGDTCQVCQNARTPRGEEPRHQPAHPRPAVVGGSAPIHHAARHRRHVHRR